MCNIAGYVGNKQAAPILLEMLRRQQDYDGGVCTGIATIHEGRIHYRKIVGDVDTLIKHTDALNLPGTIGIAHTRPGGTAETWAHAHPFITMEENLAMVTNGTGRGPGYTEKTYELIKRLEAEGCEFRDGAYIEKSGFPQAKDGKFVSCVEVRMNLINKYIKEGKSTTEAMAMMAAEMYTDSVQVLLNRETPDKIYALRTTRPMAALLADGETYIATTRLAFPEDIDAEVMQLPVMYACEISADGVKITKDKMTGCEDVAEPTAYTFAEGYNRIVKLLTGKKDEPLYFDDLEIAVWKDMRDIYPGDHSLIQDARIVYDVIYQLKQEGRLKSERRLFKNGQMYREYMWLED